MIRIPLERTGDLRCDPTAIEAALLRGDPFTVDPATVHACGVQRKPSSQLSKPLGWTGVGPDRPIEPAIAVDHIEITRHTFPLAERGPTASCNEQALVHRLWRQVVSGGVEGLENPQAA